MTSDDRERKKERVKKKEKLSTRLLHSLCHEPLSLSLYSLLSIFPKFVLF